MTHIPEAAVEAGAKAMTTDQMRSVLHAAGLEFSPAQDTLIRYWARLAVEAAAPLIAHPDAAVEAAVLADQNLEMLIRDLRPYAKKQVGSLRIDMEDVRSILAFYDARSPAPKPAPDALVEASVAIEKISELQFSEADWPLDDAIEIARKWLAAFDPSRLPPSARSASPKPGSGA